MELKYNLNGCEILEIQKTGDRVKLRFADPTEGGKLSISFDGIIFETPSVKLNSRVIRAELTNVPGFKAMDQLTHQGKDPHLYKQLLIVLSGSTECYKSEIICVFQDCQMRRQQLAAY